MTCTCNAQGQAAAAAALHALVRGDPDNQRRLAAVAPAGLSAAIHRSLATGASTATSPTSSGGGGSCGSNSTSSAVGSNAAGSNSNGNCSLARFFRCDKGATDAAAAAAVAGSWGCLTKPLPVEEHATHRGELLALNHVIARHLTPVVAVAAAPVAAPTAASAPAPSTSVLQRLQRLRMRRAAPAPTRGVAVPKASSPARPSSPAGAGNRAPTSGVASEAGLLQADAAAAVLVNAVTSAAGAAVPRSPSDDGVKVERSRSPSADVDLDWESDMGSPTRATATKGSAGVCTAADDRGGSDVSSGTEAMLTAALMEPLAMRALPAASSGSRA